MDFLNESDTFLWQKTREGNAKAFEALFHRYKRPLFLTACKKAPTYQDAEDILHDVFSKLWEKRTTVHIQTSVGNYLWQMLRNEIINAYQRQSNQVLRNSAELTISDHPSFDPQNAYEAKDQLAFIRKKINELPEKCRLVFNMSRRHQFTNNEIAKKLNISEQTVKNQISKALKSISSFFI